MDLHELVRQLLDGLGSKTLVATLSGATSRDAPVSWAQSDGPIPTPNEAVRLRAAHQCWTMLAETQSAAIARMWFVGANPLLGGSAPATELRSGRIADVTAAAEAFQSGRW